MQPAAESTSFGDNVLPIRDGLSLESNVVDENVIAIHSGPMLNVVESVANDNDLEALDSADQAGACVNGVCSISWKPKRPTAA